MTLELVPFPRIETRQEHVQKHYYGRFERWFECSGQAHPEWNRDRLIVDGIVITNLPLDSDAAKTLARGHTYWFDASHGAVKYAVEKGHAYPHKEVGRRVFAGSSGVVVVVAMENEDTSGHLVTAFRPHECAQELREKTKKFLTDVQWERLGVRRAKALSSLPVK